MSKEEEQSSITSKSLEDDTPLEVRLEPTPKD